MTKYWFALTNEQNWDTIKNYLVYGFSDKNSKYLYRISKGDKVVIYVIPKQIGGLFEFGNRMKNNEIEFKYKSYPNQVRLNKIEIFENLIKINEKLKKRVIDKLSIFKNKMWSGVLQGATIIEITESDFEHVKKVLID